MTRPLSSNVRAKVRSLQNSLIKKAERFLEDESFSQSLKDAFFDTPRHVFAPRFQDGTQGLWGDVEDDLLLQHLDTLYSDQPYCIFRDDQGETTSTISQPSLVLFMLHLLDLQPGQRVFELGGGSGWNAALISRLVGPQGHVTSIEIETSLVANAQQALSELKISSVSLLSGDAYSEIENHKPFDRGVFTASAWELPSFFFDKIKENGLLLFVLKFTPDSDLLVVLRKKKDSFVSELHFPCRFVPISRIGVAEPLQTRSPEETAFFRELESRHWEPEDLHLEIHAHPIPPSELKGAYAFNRGDSQFVWTPLD